MHTIDLLIVGLYLSGMLVIGFCFSKKVHSSIDFFVANRSLGLFTIIATVCATIIGGGALIGRGGIVYSQGAVAVWLALPYFIGMIIFSFISSRIHEIGVKYNVISIPGLFERRFGKSAKLLVAILIAYTMLATVGAQISATATILKITLSQWGISYEMGAIIATIIFIIYTSMSGLFGVVYTDVLQVIILIGTIYIILPIISITKIGGFDELIRLVPVNMWNLSPDTTIIGYIFTNFVFTLAGAEMWQRAFASKSSKVAFKGTFLGTVVYGTTIISTLMIGLCAFILLPNLTAEYGTIDAAVPALVLHILPTGLVGITIAGLLAVMMSSSDSYLLITTQTIIDDILRTIKPEIDEKKILLFSKIAIPVLGIIPLVIALYIQSAYAALMFAWTFYAASVGIPAFAAIFWKKATKSGIISSVSVGFMSSVAWEIMGKPFSIAPSIVGSLTCGVVVVIVSLITFQKSADISPNHFFTI